MPRRHIFVPSPRTSGPARTLRTLDARGVPLTWRYRSAVHAWTVPTGRAVRAGLSGAAAAITAPRRSYRRGRMAASLPLPAWSATAPRHAVAPSARIGLRRHFLPTRRRGQRAACRPSRAVRNRRRSASFRLSGPPASNRADHRTNEWRPERYHPVASRLFIDQVPTTPASMYPHPRITTHRPIHPQCEGMGRNTQPILSDGSAPPQRGPLRCDLHDRLAEREGGAADNSQVKDSSAVGNPVRVAHLASRMPTRRALMETGPRQRTWSGWRFLAVNEGGSR